MPVPQNLNIVPFISVENMMDLCWPPASRLY